MIRVFPRRTKWTPTDDLAFVGDPPFEAMRPAHDVPVYISVCFTWDVPEAFRLATSWGRYYRDVRVGGPGLATRPGEFVPGRFIKPGVTITSRGCPYRCPWCLVPQVEGDLRELPIQPGWIVQDNNLLACSREHVEAVFRMLDRQPRAAIFSGGLAPGLLCLWHVTWFRQLRINELWFSCDQVETIPELRRAADMLDEIPQEKRRCYALIGFAGEPLALAEERLEEIYGCGFLPFAQLYRGPDLTSWSAEWRALARKWSRPAAYRGGRKQQLTTEAREDAEELKAAASQELLRGG